MHQLHADRQYLHASPLHPAATGVIVRMHEGKPLVADGPFVEMREQLAGYFLIDAQGLNEAIRITTRVPDARIGTVEVRPVKDISGLPGESWSHQRFMAVSMPCRFLAARSTNG